MRTLQLESFSVMMWLALRRSAPLRARTHACMCAAEGDERAGGRRQAPMLIGWPRRLLLRPPTGTSCPNPGALVMFDNKQALAWNAVRFSPLLPLPLCAKSDGPIGALIVEPTVS